VSFAALAPLCDNALPTNAGGAFAALIGLHPSRGARSPTLWNAAFAAHGFDARMLPIDVEPARLVELLTVLDDDPVFLGGAVTTPHKEAVARWLGQRVTPEARIIGAVNCLFRGPDGRLAGTNTDGEGALVSFETRYGVPAGNHVMLLGAGGAAKAVATFCKRAVGSTGQLTICSRSANGESLAERLGAKWCPWAQRGAPLEGVDVIVNCTSVGAATQRDASPLDDEHLDRVRSSAVVFDIIYDPSPTVLLTLARARGLSVLDGSAMNLEQAVLAYAYAAPAPKGSAETRVAMVRAKQRLG
jgi:shikimate dehydrogenase